MIKLTYHNKFIQLTVSGGDVPGILDNLGGVAQGYIDDTPIENGKITFYLTGEFCAAVKLAQGAADSIRPVEVKPEAPQGEAPTAPVKSKKGVNHAKADA